MYYTDPMHDISSRDKPLFYKLSSFYTYLDFNAFKSCGVYFQDLVFQDDKNKSEGKGN